MHWNDKYNNVAEVLFNKIVVVCFVLLIQLESFIFLCYNPVIFLVKNLKLLNSSRNENFLTIPNTNNVYFLILFVSFFSLKTFSHYSYIIFLVILLLCLINKYFQKLTYYSNHNNTIYLILPSFGVFLVLIPYVDSFISLFFFIEIYGVLYYFCFLTSYSFTNQTVLKYRNGLLLLLWNNFLTTLLLALGNFFLLKNFGTTNFSELTLLNTTYTGVYLFLLGLFWKLGLPIFHFFKLEVYKYLLKENVFLFSILTTLINFFLFYMCFSNSIFFDAVYSFNLLTLVFFFSLILLIINFKISNFLQFFAFSGVLTITTILVIFLL